MIQNDDDIDLLEDTKFPSQTGSSFSFDDTMLRNVVELYNDKGVKKSRW